MRHYLNGVEVSPRNNEDIGFKSNWSASITDRDSRELALTVDSVNLPNEAKQIILDWIGVNGVFQGIPYTVKLDDNTTVEYYVDLTEQTKYRDYDIEVKLKRRKSFDNFFELAKSTSFELFKQKGVVFNTIDIPYFVVPDNVTELGVTLSATLFNVSKTLIEEIRKTAELIAETTTSLIPSVGVGLVVNVGAIALALIKVILQVIYLVALVLALIKLTQQLINLAFPKIRNFKACRVKELIKKGCEYYGYTLQSSLLNNLDKLTLLPIPLVKSKHKGFKGVFDYIKNDLDFAFTKGYPSSQDSVNSLWSLIEAVETTFNAHTRVVDGVVQIERVDFFSSQANTQIPIPLTLQGSRQNEFQYNVFDSWKRYYIHYQPDYSDIHTLDNFDFTDSEYSTEPNNVVNTDLVTIKGLQDRNIPFALGTRKEKLNFIETKLKELFVVVEALTGLPFVNKIENRKGVLIISNQFYSVSKLLWCDNNGKQPSNYGDFLSPPKLWDKYHNINEIQQNGYKIKENVKILMNQEKYVLLLNNNTVEIDGVVCELLSLEYKERDSFATITYKEPFDYASSHVNTLVINE